MDSPTLSDNSRDALRETPVVLALTTWPADTDPGVFARTLLEARLVACVSMLPGVRSVYRWQGRIEENAEVLLLLKTTADRVPLLREHMVSHHPYEVPELLVFPAGDGLPAYLAWVREEVA